MYSTPHSLIWAKNESNRQILFHIINIKPLKIIFIIICE
jgi:hypothetical protein